VLNYRINQSREQGNPLTFERTTDYALLNSILRNSSSLYPFLGDDFAPAIADAAVVEHPDLWYILAVDEVSTGRLLLGFWMFHADNGNSITWAFHTAMPLDARGLTALRDMVGPDGWLWSHTPCLRAVTSVPEENAIARRFGLRAGLKVYGTNPNSYLKNGKLQSQILMGISKVN